MKNIHSRTQALTFLTYLNKVLDDNFIRLEIKNLSEGEPVQVKNYVKNLPDPSIEKEETKEILWVYNRTFYQSKNIETALDGFSVGIDSIESMRVVNSRLKKHLDKLGLPSDLV